MNDPLQILQTSYLTAIQIAEKQDFSNFSKYANKETAFLTKATLSKFNRSS